tara:strand:+ start:1265 stop:1882 length:618 start_codon:yes stop_codon:yes gene_type:complete
MATNKRTFPNTYFTWYNDDNRLAILAEDTSSTGERTTEKYDTYQGTGNLSGTITDIDGDGTTATAACTSHGLTTGDRITISGSTNYNGSFSITRVDDNSFTFSDPSDGSSDNETGTFISLFIDNGLRITYHSKYEEADATTDNLQSDLGLDSALHNAVVCYVKARLYEDDEDIEYANYYRQMYERKIKKFRGRRSAVRYLAVTRL